MWHNTICSWIMHQGLAGDPLPPGPLYTGFNERSPVAWPMHQGLAKDYLPPGPCIRVRREIPCRLANLKHQGLAGDPLPAGPVRWVPAAALDPLAPVTLEPAAVRGVGALTIPVPVVAIPAATAHCIWGGGHEEEQQGRKGRQRKARSKDIDSSRQSIAWSQQCDQS